MIEFLVGLACFTVGYFAQQTLKGKMRIAGFFLTVLSVALTYCVSFEIHCFVTKSCDLISMNELVTAGLGSLGLASTCAGLLYCVLKYKNREKVTN